MKTKKRQKLCYNCEGEVDLDVIVCPFCASDLREEKPEETSAPFQHHLKNLDTQATLYPPAYAPRIRVQEEEAPPAPSAPITEGGEEPRASYGAIVLLTLGAQLLLLGLFMLFFSTKGTLTLKWYARFWYFYVLASVPLLIFGAKSVNKL